MMICTDCKNYRFCPERSRMYPCRDFKLKEGERMASEKNFENQVKKFLIHKEGWFVKYWGGGEFTRAGVPDILACVKGRFFGIEVKAEKGKPSALQIANLRKIDNAGGFAILLYPDHFECFKNLIDCLIEGDTENTNFNYNILKRGWEEWELQFR